MVEIGVCGFSSTGSSAVVDYIKEFDSVCTLDNMEFILTYYPDGIEDLEYHLNSDCSKYTASVVAIERFRRHVYNYWINRTCNKHLQKQIIMLTEEFIADITQVKWRGNGLSDVSLSYKQHYKSQYNRICNRMNYIRVIRKLGTMLSIDIDRIFVHDMEFSIRPEGFETRAQKYIHDFLELYGADYHKKIVLNQPFCGNNPIKSFRFFESPVAIVVDRDPRDNYAFAKKFLRLNGRQIPTDSVENFVEYYRRMRDNQPYKNYDDRVLRIQFEDMIYKYDETTKMIREFCGLSLDDKIRTLFVPEMSINNTQVFRRYLDLSEDIIYIEKHLSEYLYPFELYYNKATDGNMFFGKSPLNK